MQLHCLVRSELCCRGICTAGAVQFYLYISWVLYRCTYTSLVCTIVHVHPVRCILDYIAHYCMVILYVFALYTWLVQNIVQSHLHIVQCHWHFYCLSDSSSSLNQAGCLLIEAISRWKHAHIASEAVRPPRSEAAVPCWASEYIGFVRLTSLWGCEQDRRNRGCREGQCNAYCRVGSTNTS